MPACRQPSGQSESAGLLLLDIDECISRLEEMRGWVLRRKKPKPKQKSGHVWYGMPGTIPTHDEFLILTVATNTESEYDLGDCREYGE
jgi:hypothetical protein